MPRTATADRVHEQLLAFLRPRHRALLATRRADGSPQLSPVAAGVDAEGRVVEVLAPPEALDAFVDDYRSIAGEHPDWDEYRAAMVRQGEVLLRGRIERWDRSPRAASHRSSPPADLDARRDGA